MRLNNLRGGASKPLIERDILEVVRSEHFQENYVGVASVFDIVAGVGGNVADVIGVKVDSAGIVDRKEDGHASSAGDPELPFSSVRMPMQLPHSSRLDRNKAAATCLDAGKFRESTANADAARTIEPVLRNFLREKASTMRSYCFACII